MAPLKSYIDRILNVLAEIDDLGIDKKAIYKELASDGYDRTVVSQVVGHIRKKTAKPGKFAEQSQLFDLYLADYEGIGTRVATHTLHASTEADDEPDHDPETGEILNDENDVRPNDSVNTDDEASHAPSSGPNSADEADHQSTAVRKDGLSTDDADGSPSSIMVLARDDEHGVAPLPEVAPVDTNSATPPADQTTEGTAPQPSVVDRSQPISENVTVPAAQPSGDGPSAVRASIPGPLGQQFNPGGDDAHDLSKAGEATTDASPVPGSVRMERVHLHGGVTRHQFQAAFPEHFGPPFYRLRDDIKANGVREPIVMQGNVLLDGWHRYNAARELGVEYPVLEYAGDDPLADIIKLNMASRNLHPVRRQQIAIRLGKLVPPRADEIAELLGLDQHREAAE